MPTCVASLKPAHSRCLSLEPIATGNIRCLLCVRPRGQLSHAPETSRSSSLDSGNATLHSRRDFAGVSKELEMGRLVWIFWMGPKCHLEGINNKETEKKKKKEKKRRQGGLTQKEEAM